MVSNVNDVMDSLNASIILALSVPVQTDRFSMTLCQFGDSSVRLVETDYQHNPSTPTVAVWACGTVPGCL